MMWVLFVQLTKPSWSPWPDALYLSNVFPYRNLNSLNFSSSYAHRSRLDVHMDLKSLLHSLLHLHVTNTHYSVQIKFRSRGFLFELSIVLLFRFRCTSLFVRTSIICCPVEIILVSDRTRRSRELSSLENSGFRLLFVSFIVTSSPALSLQLPFPALLLFFW